MIMPSKYVREQESLLGMGAVVLNFLTSDMPLSELWEHSKEKLDTLSFERFVLALDMLFVMELIVVEGQLIKRIAP